jgi:hypothetical protein
MNRLIACIMVACVCLMGTGCKSFVSKLYGIPKKEVVYVYPSLRTLDIAVHSDNVQWMDSRIAEAKAWTVYSCNSSSNECTETPYVDEGTGKVALGRKVAYMHNLIQIINFKTVFPDNDIARIMFTEQSTVQ